MNNYFRRQFSRTFAPPYIVDDIIKGEDNGKVTALVLFDMTRDLNSVNSFP